MQTMRIAVDIQALQSVDSRDRGIGRYTFQLFQKILELDLENEYLIIANANLPEPDLKGFPADRYSCVSLAYPDNDYQASEIILEAALLSSDIDIFHITNPMGMNERVIIPCFKKPSPFKVVSTAYDIIPYLFSERYLSDQAIQKRYHFRLNNLATADYIFAISECTRRDIIKNLSISPDKITNIGGGVNPSFKPLPDGARSRWLQKLKHKFNISDKFIFYVGGDEARKNMEGLIRAYSKLPDSLIEEYQLVISCRLAPGTNRYTNIGKECNVDRRLVLTNFVTEDELLALYSLCTVFVFPSEYEGFGLPVVEAMSCGAPVIATNTSSIPEVAGDAAVLVEPGSAEHLIKEVQRVLMDDQLRAEMSRHSLEQAGRFTWDNASKKVMDTYRQLGRRHATSFNFRRISGSTSDKPKIALFSPVNPIKSGISDYTEELLPYLAEHFEIDLYLDSNYQPSNAFISRRCRWYDHHTFERRIEEEKYTAVLYQLGNSSHHAYMIDYILKYGGIITLHDYALGGLINWLSTRLPGDSPNRLDLFEELEFNYGETQAEDTLKKMQRGEIEPHELCNEGIFLNKRFFDRSISMVVNNRYAYEMAKKTFPDYPGECLLHLPHGVPIQPKPTAKEIRVIRQRLGIPENALVIAAFGNVASPKRVASSIKAFAKLHRENSRAMLIFVGECSPGYTEPMELIQELGLGEKVRITGYVDFKLFYDYMKACDVVLSLRYPTQGETSGALLRALSLGKPAIVSNGGAFMEFPDDVVLKVVYGPNDGHDVAEKLTLLVRNEQIRQKMGENARSYILKYHSLDSVSKQYVDFILNVVQNSTARIKLGADLAGKMLMKEESFPIDEKAIDLAGQAIFRMNFLQRHNRNYAYRS